MSGRRMPALWEVQGRFFKYEGLEGAFAALARVVGPGCVTSLLTRDAKVAPRLSQGPGKRVIGLVGALHARVPLLRSWKYALLSLPEAVCAAAGNAPVYCLISIHPG